MLTTLQKFAIAMMVGATLALIASTPTEEPIEPSVGRDWSEPHVSKMPATPVAVTLYYVWKVRTQ